MAIIREISSLKGWMVTSSHGQSFGVHWCSSVTRLTGLEDAGLTKGLLGLLAVAESFTLQRGHVISPNAS